MSSLPNPTVADPNLKRLRMSVRNRILFFVVAWAIVLMPFLFWHSTWFGRALTDRELDQYLHETDKPRHVQHALVQLGERMARHDASAARWYPDAVRLASSPVDEIRNTDAWIMGQDTSRPDFHQALLTLLHDSSPMVRSNAALSLVRFGDASGRPQLVEMLQPAKVAAPQAGRISDVSKAGTAVRQGGTVAKLNTGSSEIELRTPIAGRIRSLAVDRGAQVQGGAPVAIVDPAGDQVWEALRALYLVGEKDDLPAIEPYKAGSADLADRVRQQAILTEKAILNRSAK
ncbi:MAG: HEAT repeat domain-containing protein [Terriglobales bacterium]